MSEEQKQNIKPCGFKVLVKIVPVEETTEGGIILGTASSHQKERAGRDLGEILSVGPLAFRGYKGCLDLKGPEDWGVKIGDVVEFRRYDGKVPRPDGYEDYRYIDDEDIIAVIEDKDKT